MYIKGAMKMTHPKFEVSDDPHAKYRYESAKKHAQAAKDAGKSSEEIHEVFKKVMNSDATNIPQDEAHSTYRSAMAHVEAAKKAGKSPDEIHEMYKRIMNGEAKGNCVHSK